MALIGFDTEFFNSNEAKMTIIAAVLVTPEGPCRYNLLDEEDLSIFKAHLDHIQLQGDTLVAHAVTAEARALISLGYNPLDFKWVDTYVEFIMLCNSNNDFKHGNYLSKQGDICFSIPPEPGVEDERDHTESPKNLVNVAYKMLGIRLGQEEKDTMRDLILSKNLDSIAQNMEAILTYCESDTLHLVPILNAINRVLDTFLDNFEGSQLERGEYAAATGMSESLGIPINLKFLNTVIQKTPEILNNQKETVNEHFQYFLPGCQKPPVTRKNGNVFHYKYTEPKKSDAAYQSYVVSLNIPNFPQTATGKFKSDKDTLEEFGYWGGLEALWKYNKTEASLKWFNKGNKNGFFDRFSYVDECVRPYYGIFGTQTGRNAAKAKTFPLAMSSWLRAIVSPRPGHVIIGSDFSQQEVYVAAILSKDLNLLDAYKSGDVYLAFAKQAGLVPTDATKHTHKLERMLCKSTVLG